MQQMSNILLIGSGQTNKASKDALFSAEANNMATDRDAAFLTAFEQASQASLVQPTKVNSFVSDQSSVADLDLSEPLDETDIELIFAQLDMAQNFSQGGKVLPINAKEADSEIKTEDSTEALMAEIDTLLKPENLKNDLVLENPSKTDFSKDIKLFEPIITIPELVKTSEQLLDSLTFDQKQALMQEKEISFSELSTLSFSDLQTLIRDIKVEDYKSDKSNLFDPIITIPELVKTSEQLLDSLTFDQKQALMDVGNMSLSELANQPLDTLKGLVQDVNLQAPVLDESILSLVDAPQKVDAAILVKNEAVTNSETLTKTAVTLEQSLSGVSKVGTDKNILGTQDENLDLITPNSSLKFGDKADLANAKMQVELIPSSGKDIPEFARKESSTFTSADFTKELSHLQNQSSHTPVHKSEVPQFQLSLKQQGEAPTQMHEMIQRFSPVMKQQLITMVSNGVQQAEIRLDPPELGHLTVKIEVRGEQTQVQFHVAQAQTRDLIEQAIPRLRDMLSQEGLQLADSHVSHGGGGHAKHEQQSSQSERFGAEMDENSAEDTHMTQKYLDDSHSGIDYYA